MYNTLGFLIIVFFSCISIIHLLSKPSSLKLIHNEYILKLAFAILIYIIIYKLITKYVLIYILTVFYLLECNIIIHIKILQ